MASKKKTTKPAKSQARTYYPPKTFDDDLVAFVELFGQKKWTFSGVDLGQLTQDSKDQRTERQSYDAAAAAFQQQHATFGTAQEARYQRFAAALNAARGAFRNDKVIMALLEKFKRSYVRAKKAAAATPPKTG